MVDATYLTALRALVMRLEQTDVMWALTGSLAFALQGVPAEPHDIDVQTDAAGAYAIEQCFAAHVTRPVTWATAAQIHSHFGALTLGGLRVEIMGGLQKRRTNGTWEPPVDVERHRRFIAVADLRVPVLSLEHEYQAYLLLDRREKAEVLRAWLQRTRAAGDVHAATEVPD